MVIPPKLLLFWTVTFFIINGCEMSIWVKNSLNLTEVVDKCGSTRFNGTLLNSTASERFKHKSKIPFIKKDGYPTFAAQTFAAHAN
jgi:hypothetical protein